MFLFPSQAYQDSVQWLAGALFVPIIEILASGGSRIRNLALRCGRGLWFYSVPSDTLRKNTSYCTISQLPDQSIRNHIIRRQVITQMAKQWKLNQPQSLVIPIGIT
jgi:hypothetical protein